MAAEYEPRTIRRYCGTITLYIKFSRPTGKYYIEFARNSTHLTRDIFAIKPELLKQSRSIIYDKIAFDAMLRLAKRIPSFASYGEWVNALPVIGR